MRDSGPLADERGCYLGSDAADSHRKERNTSLNQGNGVFATAVDYPAGATPTSVLAADLDGDGKPDLAVANTSGDTVSVLLTRCVP